MTGFIKPLVLATLLALLACLMEQYMVSMLSLKPPTIIGLEPDYSSSMERQ